MRLTKQEKQEKFEILAKKIKYKGITEEELLKDFKYRKGKVM